MGSSGLEPPTSRLSGARSNRLSYEPIIESGNHLFSQAVSHQVSSADYVLTFVFGMGTGVSHNRIITGNFSSALLPVPSKPNKEIIAVYYRFVNYFQFHFFLGQALDLLVQVS